MHPIVEHLVAQHLHALAQGVLERAGNLGGVAARLCVELVHERGTLGAQAVVGKQRGGSVLGLARQHLAQVYVQASLLGPLVTVAEQDVPHGEHKHEASRLGRAKEKRVHQGFQGILIGCRHNGGQTGRVKRPRGEHALVAAPGLKSQRHPHLGRTVGCQKLAPHRSGIRALVGHLRQNCLRKAQRSEHTCGVFGGKLATARLRGGFVKAHPGTLVRLTKTAQFCDRIERRTILGGILPGLGLLLHHVLKVRSKVMLGEELVFVGNTRKVDAHRAAPVMTARILMLGLF